MCAIKHSHNNHLIIINQRFRQFIAAYKTTTSKKIHLLDNNNFAWQRSFYDHVIRNTKSYEKIFTYILNNPLNWDEDMFNEISI